MSESDDDDLSITIKKRKSLNKNNAIQDLSSDDEAAIPRSNDTQNAKSKKRIINSSSDEEGEEQNDTNASASQSSSAVCGSESTLGIKNLDLNSSDSTSKCNLVDKELLNGSDPEASDGSGGESRGKVRSKVRQFADSSSEEEMLSSSDTKSKRSSDRVSMKKSTYRSKLKSAKGSQGRSPVGSDMDGEGKSAMSCVDADIMGGNDSTEDVGVDKLLHNKDLFDMEDSDDEQSSKNKVSDLPERNLNGLSSHQSSF